ncbi:26S PROTEASOME NON-ATPASE REGULATORY SUBUNIT 3/COP9 SIGNALOSOME COMPLEX SUBUNIT 3 [Salix purpurea]|uniref:26S PROTEASOME NON-ATPASE REGULATORY SUBUNIT 3/COP9 SIGNALOSOME COMPLEX SUBUNIT 3 n=1 Tax=Salix purpurea TaxID=77065 RepID=A0A9Q0ZN57_SALPP|nr:26S PROTEASOME NON-ATPASE REGULATORY SUBUNIT 3/COP9 SIGNALOSOME COMPLEX SUBUNIT 3 [Salix purpurea]
MICIGQKYFQKALELPHNVVTTPMPSINTIAVEAFKKYILVSLIQNRLIQDGEIHATINQKDGMVRFLEDPEQYKNSKMIERINS